MKKQKTTGNSEHNLKYTVQGEWFPEITLSGGEKTKPGETVLDTEMRLFCACTRWAFNRLLEGYSRKELKKQGQGMFGINSRFCDDAILKAQAIIKSQKELLVTEIQETEQKLIRAKKKLSWAKRDLAKAIESSDPVKIKKRRLVASGRKMRVKALSEKLDELKTHLENGTIPKVVFGGRALWKKVCKGRATREEWRQARQNRLFSRGDKTKGGNPNIKVVYRKGEFYLSVTISHLAEPGKIDARGVQHMKPAPRIEGKLWIPPKHRLKVWELLLAGEPYTVELIKGKDNRYRAHITFDTEKPARVSDSACGYLGIDINPDGVAVANIGYTGQPEPWPENFTVPYPKALHKFEGEFQVKIHPNGFLYIKIPELSYSRSFRRTYLIGVLAKVIVDIAKELGKPVALEKLDFGKDRLDTGKKFNRMASNFPYRKAVEAVIRRAHREGIGIKQVWPAHTSTIGYWKYMQKYGVTVHHAAAYAIARRAMGFKERITRELKQKITAIKEKLKVNTVPGEGKGMTRKVKRLFNRLDEKLILHNGLTRYKQESFYSVWHELKRLALLSR